MCVWNTALEHGLAPVTLRERLSRVMSVFSPPPDSGRGGPWPQPLPRCRKAPVPPWGLTPSTLGLLRRAGPSAHPGGRAQAEVLGDEGGFQHSLRGDSCHGGRGRRQEEPSCSASLSCGPQRPSNPAGLLGAPFPTQWVAARAPLTPLGWALPERPRRAGSPVPPVPASLGGAPRSGFTHRGWPGAGRAPPLLHVSAKRRPVLTVLTSCVVLTWFLVCPSSRPGGSRREGPLLRDGQRGPVCARTSALFLPAGFWLGCGFRLL